MGEPSRRGRGAAIAAAKGVVFCVLCLFAGFAAAAEQEGLFATAPPPPAVAPTAVTPTPGANLPAKRSRWVVLDMAQLDGLAPPQAEQRPKNGGAKVTATQPALTLNLFDDARFEAIVERRSAALSGHMVRGKLGGQPGRWTLVVRDGAARGTVLTPNRAFVIRPATGGRHIVSEVDRAWFPPDDPNAEWRVRVPPDPVAPMPSQLPSQEREQMPRGNRPPAPPPSRAPPQSAAVGLPTAGGRWVPIGPAPIRYGQVEHVVPDNEVVGAIHTVLAHPTNQNILYIGAVNGGVWRTDDATATRPTWRPLTDDLPSLSISAMAFDPNDPNTILAGIGRYSSYGRSGGDRVGLLLTKDGGATWRHVEIPYGDLFNKNISGVVVDGDRLIASIGPWANSVYRSLDGGATWTPGTGLPDLGAMDLVVDPTDRNRLYVTMRERGVYRSDDGGASWTNVSSHDETLHDAFTEVATNSFGEEGRNNNAEMAVAYDGRLYLAVLVAGQANYIGYTDNHGGAWTAMDLPLTPEPDGIAVGLNPRFKPGGQGAIHFSIRADPTHPNIVYVGGDRQDFRCAEDGSGDCGNFIGATDYTGRLFRGNTAVAATGAVPSPQWEHLTHSGGVVEIQGGGTASGSAPHADSREMVFDAAGDIIQVDDGGIYRRTSPRSNRGDWFSLNGNLQVSEMHNVAYDPLAEVVIGGNQDTGTPEQPTSEAQAWDTVQPADGGDVAVDASNAPDYSIRYSSTQYLGFFIRRRYNQANTLLEEVYPDMHVAGVSVYELAPDFAFTQPVILNAVAPHRGVLPAFRSVYETEDRFDTLTEVYAFGPAGEGSQGITAAYGCATNADLLYVGAWLDFSVGMLVRAAAGGDFRTAGYPDTADEPRDILINPNDCDTVYVADATQVYESNDLGATWTTITGNLLDVPVLWRDHRNLEFLPANGPLGEAAILVAGRGGVHVMPIAEPGVWRSMNEGLPRAPAWDLDYDPTDDVLVVSTLGRGAWRLQQGPTVAVPIADLAVEVADGATTVPLAGVFRDPVGGGLTYTARSIDDTIATVRVTGNGVAVTGRTAGAVIIEVTARDANGVSAVATFMVEVGAVLRFAGPAAAAEGEVARLTVTLSRPLQSAIEVRYSAFQVGDLANPVDYEVADDFQPLEGTLAIAAGTVEATFDIPIRDDDVIEPLRETFEVDLTAPERNPNFGLGPTASATVTVNEGICDNTAEVRDAVVAELSGVADCAEVANPAAITALDLSGRGIERLKEQEFRYFEGLRRLDLSDNRLTDLPGNAFYGVLETLLLSRNRLSALQRATFVLLPFFRELHLDGNAIAELPADYFGGLFALEVVRLHDNPGAPFPLVLQLRREDAEPWRPRSPATVYAHLREGAPFDMTLQLDVTDGEVAAAEFGFESGLSESQRVVVRQSGDKAAQVRLVLAGLPTKSFSGLDVRAGPPLLLFKAAPRVVARPPQQVVEVQGDPIVLDLDKVFGDYDSARLSLSYTATTSDENLATVSIDGSKLTITPAEREGALTVTITATDPDGLSATLVLEVVVEPPSLGRPSWRLVPLEED